jgi:molecular chaperone HscB
MSQPDHFQLFDLPPRFALDVVALDQAYRRVQGQVHPDRYASGSAAERRVAMHWAAHANEAYRTLKSPRERAAYLCERAGVAVGEESNTGMGTSFLTRQLELREALGSARERSDCDELDRLGSAASNERRHLIAGLERAIDHESNHIQAASLVRQLMFIEKLVAEIEDAKAALETSARPD